MFFPRLRIFLVVLFSLGACGFSAVAKNTMVRLDTSVGSMTFQLYDDAKPITVANFLKYVTSGRFTNSFAHRLPPGFVLQGGAFTYSDEGGVVGIPTDAAIVNEAGPFPAYSNVEGTLAMAKIGGNPDSATSSWFLNLQDNNTGPAEDGNLDLQNSGFTVFGALVSGQDVLEKFKAFIPYTGGVATNVVADISQGATNSPFTQVPLAKVTDGSFDTDDLIYTTWTVLTDPVPSPDVTTKGSIFGKNGRAILKGSATAGTMKVEVKVGKKPYKIVKGTPTNWTFPVHGLKPGKYKALVRATATDGSTTTKTVKLIIKS